MYQIELYDLINGTTPVLEFLNSMDSKMKAKTLRTIDLLEEFGPSLREPYSKALGEGLFELRIKQSTNMQECFFFFDGEK